MCFEQALQDIQSNSIGDYVCVAAQLLLTLLTLVRLWKNQDKFPIKQLSPLCTAAALLSFLLTNVVSLCAKLLQEHNNYYKPYPAKTESEWGCGQCRLRDHTAMITLSITYIALREFPLVVFTLKTFRVCLCSLYQIELNVSKKLLIKIFSSEWIILFICLLYSASVAIFTYFDFSTWESPANGRMTFQFLCPKDSQWLDWIFTLLRCIMMSIVYALSLKTFRNLDFKGFLLLIFLINNTQVLLRIVLSQLGIEETTYHQLHYHSQLMQLIGTCILFRYSHEQVSVMAPPVEEVIDEFSLFMAFSGGVAILEKYAQALDKEQHSSKNTTILSMYREMDKIKKICMNDEKELSRYKRQLYNIFTSRYLYEKSVGNLANLKQSCIDGMMKVEELRPCDRFLTTFVREQLYDRWKKTASCKYLRALCKDHAILNNRMEMLGISITS